ncbi:MAG: hypothetical protein ACJ8GO_12790 [Ramlibacter sp.]
MPLNSISAYNRWREANERAKAKEEELSRAWIEFFDRRDGVPSDGLIAEVAALRAYANERLKETMAAKEAARASSAPAEPLPE